MKDRVSLYPGRVKLAPVSGHENTYDMVRADEPTQEGTPLNKATLLKDATAALYGLGADAVPDDVLSLIKSLIDTNTEGIANGVKIATGSYTGTGTYGASNKNSLTLDFAPKVLVVRNGLFTLAPIMLFLPHISGEQQGWYNGTAMFFTISETTVYWYSKNSASDQLNSSGKTYDYVAIG